MDFQSSENSPDTDNAAEGRADESLFGLHTDAGHVDDMFSNWFLDYASYVILERAVPHANDGLKPVQKTYSSFAPGIGRRTLQQSGQCHWQYDEVSPAW